MVETSDERQRVQRNLERLRDAVGREIGWMPRARRWILPITAFAVGVAIALKRRQGRALAGRSGSSEAAAGSLGTPAPGRPKAAAKAPLGPRRMARGKTPAS